MRTLCAPIMGLALLAATISGCTDEAERDIGAYRPAVFVSGETVGETEWRSGGAVTSTWEVSDSRMSGDVTVTARETSEKQYGGPRLSTDQRRATISVTALELVNARRWQGHATEISVQDPQLSSNIIVLSTGDTTAYLVADGEVNELSFRGLIFPGPMPPVPELSDE